MLGFQHIVGETVQHTLPAIVPGRINWQSLMSNVGHELYSFLLDFCNVSFEHSEVKETHQKPKIILIFSIFFDDFGWHTLSVCRYF